MDAGVVEGVRDRARIPRFVVVPTNGRPCITDCLNAIGPQVDKVFVVDTNTEAAWKIADYEGDVYFVDVDAGVNISWWWNRGLDSVARYASRGDHKKWDVAILNDDVIVPEGWFDAVSGTMRGMQVAAGCSGGYGTMPVLHTHPGPVGIQNRMQGFAFILAGELGVRANEEYRWYYSDNYVEYKSREAGGVVMVPGHHVQHLYPNQQVSGEMQVMIAEDGEKWMKEWGHMPW